MTVTAIIYDWDDTAIDMVEVQVDKPTKRKIRAELIKQGWSKYKYETGDADGWELVGYIPGPAFAQVFRGKESMLAVKELDG